MKGKADGEGLARVAVKSRKRAKPGKRKAGRENAPKSTAAQPVESGAVVDPEGRLRVVERRVDTVDMLYRRRQIDARQRQAADMFKNAHDAMIAGIPCALDQSRVGGGSAHSPAPGETALWGAETMAEASRVLGLLDGAILHMVLGNGMTIEEAAARIHGADARGRAGERDAKHVGRRLREALTMLADEWYPVRKGHMVRSGELAGIVAGPAGLIEQGRWAHAGGGRVFTSDDAKRGDKG